MTANNAIDYIKCGTELLRSLEAVEGAISRRGLDEGLRHLVKLRASQINGCGYCVALHSSEARRDGESDERLDQLTVWRHSDRYSDAEKAALGWTDALTTLAAQDELSRHRDEMRTFFAEEDIATLTAIIGMINLWNRIQISNH